MRRLLLALALVLAIAPSATAAVVFDANATADTAGSSILGTTGVSSTNLTVGSGANRALVVQIAFGVQAVTTVAVVWDSGGTNQALTLIGTLNSTTTTGRVDLYGLVAPTSGAKTLKLTWNAVTSDVTMNAVSWTGVNQTGGVTSFPHFTSARGQSTAISLAITSAVGNATMDATETSGTPSAPTQTQTYLDTSRPTISGCGSRGTGAATVTHAWTTSGSSDFWVQVGTDILAASGGVACTPTLLLMGVGRCG